MPRQRKTKPPPPTSGPQIAAGEAFAWLLDYAQSTGTPADRLPELLLPRDGDDDRDGGAWTVDWPAGPDCWALRLLLGDPIRPGGPSFDLSRFGVRIETSSNDDLLFFPALRRAR